MQNVKKHCLLIGLAAIFSGSSLAAQAGITHSGGGHSMVNARNDSAIRSVSTHNAGGHVGGFQGNDLGKVADYIRAHGGTVTVNKDSGKVSINVTTGKGGTFSSYTTQTKVVTSPGYQQNHYDSLSNATTGKGKTYSGIGSTDVIRSLPSTETHDGSFQSTHVGTVSGKNTVNNSTADSNGTWNEESKNVTHTKFSADSSGNNYHSKSIDGTKDGNGVFIDRSESSNMTGVNGNNLQTSTESMVTKVMDSETTIEHPNADEQYILYNGEPIGSNVRS
jgi:hypothetical protein